MKRSKKAALNRRDLAKLVNVRSALEANNGSEALAGPARQRRVFLQALSGAGAAAIGTGALAAEGAGQCRSQHTNEVAWPNGYLFFNPVEVPIAAAAVDAFIPADATGPGGVEAGVVFYIDRQMAGSFGGGARLYLQGPFAEGTPQQGWQLPMTPAQVMRAGLADLDAFSLERHNSRFGQLSPDDRDVILKEVEAGRVAGSNVPPRLFFELLLSLVQEGYFGDPIYGGNRGKGVWKMIGFPGVGGMYMRDVVEYRNKRYPADPKSIEDFS